jgi:hypothetical protein
VEVLKFGASRWSFSRGEQYSTTILKKNHNELWYDDIQKRLSPRYESFILITNYSQDVEVLNFGVNFMINYNPPYSR